MSDEPIPGDQQIAADPVETPKVRRISNKNPRKSPKTPKQESESEIEVPIEEFGDDPSDAPDEAGNSPESSAENKRKNRRRRGKGKSKSEAVEEIKVIEETLPEKEPEIASLKQDRPPQQNQPSPQKQRTRLDPEKVAKNAWKIYLAEVSEEGVALIGDNDARELARRCFRLSEIFLEEEERRN